MTTRLSTAALAAFAFTLGLGATTLSAATPASDREPRPATPATMSADVPLADLVRVDESARGRSGSLQIAVVQVLDVVNAAFVRVAEAAEDVTYRWLPVHGTQPEPVGGLSRFNGDLRAPAVPGMWRLALSRGGEEHVVDGLTVVTKVPFTAKQNGRLNGYVIGRYPMEGRGRTDSYAPPIGFIEVTPENQNVHVSAHLRLGQFLTKDQFNVWPKYVALDLQLIDKLELVMQELAAMGVRAERLHIMSGFRTPNYNGPGEGGRALLSRHTYGDAADVWVESGPRTGYIADLNGDGRRDTRDAEVILQAVERVEQKYPELIGGVGVYRENGSRGPFVHIDVRGHRSRW